MGTTERIAPTLIALLAAATAGAAPAPPLLATPPRQADPWTPPETRLPPFFVKATATLFDQGLVQVLQAAVTGLEPKKAYFIALADSPTGGNLQPLARFMSNPAGAAIVNAAGPIRQLVDQPASGARRYLVITEEAGGAPGKVLQHPAS